MSLKAEILNGLIDHQISEAKAVEVKLKYIIEVKNYQRFLDVYKTVTVYRLRSISDSTCRTPKIKYNHPIGTRNPIHRIFSLA